MPESRITRRVRQAVIQRAGGCCEYCRSQVRFSPDEFSIEHIQPRASGGRDEIDNLALSCQGCNGRKYTSTDAVDPITGERVPLFHPRRQRWSEHFSWDEELTVVLGLTPTGRATIEKLLLNREGVVNLRRALRVVRRHPPPEIGDTS